VLGALDRVQDNRCHLRDSHREGLAGCAGRDVNHKVEYYDVGGFTHPCPWGCGGKYLKPEWDRLSKPRIDGSASQGRTAKCCKNGQTNTPYMRWLSERLSNPPRVIRVCVHLRFASDCITTDFNLRS
jgi:hypothetical protein